MDKKHETLRQYFGYSSFRVGQEELIDAQLHGRDVLGIMPTGGGKSMCYQLPALLMDGITLVISPLISLMTDQVTALKKAGIPAAFINSTLTQGQINTVYRNLNAGMYKLVYVAPERLLTDGFLSAVSAMRLSLVAVDEAHCISQWGQDFRPSYLRITEFLDALPYRPVVSAFTATATPQVQEDIKRILKLRDPLRIVTGFDRPNLRFEVLKPKKKSDVLTDLIKQRSGKSGIIYCATRKDVEKLCDRLQAKDIPATRYHAGLSEKERQKNQEQFLFDIRPVMVATNAFGMGIDKSNVSYVIHYNMPQSMEAYYQEAGRAGRDGSEADCILLFSKADIETARYFIRNSAENEALTDAQREQVMALDYDRLDKMVGYCNTTQCLRKYILDYFGEQYQGPCGNCGSCDAEYTEEDITTQAQKILSCIKRMSDRLGYPLGITSVVRVLTGSRDRRIMELGLNSLSTYGIMKGTNRTELREIIDTLETRGYVYTHPQHQGLCLTDRAGDVLFRGERVTMQTRTTRNAPAPKQEAQTADPQLYDILKALRMQIATEEHVAAFMIFSNATLRDMAAKAPTTMPQFLEVSGVGNYKAEKYGDQFLTAIKNYKAR